MKRVTVIDYGVGNLFSVCRAFESQGAQVELTSKASEIQSAERLVLPGVGAFADGMAGLKARGLVDVIRQYANSGRPLIGMCLGMQMLFEIGEEFGEHEGLKLLPGRVVMMPQKTVGGEKLKVPHIGWNELKLPEHFESWKETVFSHIIPGDAVYFLHSYMAMPAHPRYCLAQVEYGGHPVVAAVRNDNTVGCQFHPERSGEVGLRIIRGFLEAETPARR